MDLPKVERAAGFFLVTVVVLAGYLVTIAPTASFWDASERIACAYSLGIPHPPGTPMLVLLGRIFSLIPFSGEIAYRVNLLSALSAAISSGLIYLIVVMVIAGWREVRSLTDKIAAHVSGACAGLVCGYSFTFWFNAVEAEAYAPASVFLIAPLWLALLWRRSFDKPEGKRILLVIAYLLSLSIGIHLLPLLVFPAILIFVLAVNPKEAKDWRLILTIVVLVLLGVTPYFYLLLRSRLDPGINEVSPTTWNALWDVFARKQYGAIPLLTNNVLPRRNADGTDLSTMMGIFHQFRTWARYFSWQYAPFPRGSVSSPVKFLSVLVTSLFTFLGIYGLWHNLKNEASREKLPILAVFLLLIPIILLALWFGLWLGGGLGKFAVRYAAAVLVLSWPIRWIVRNFKKHSFLLFYISIFLVAFLLTAYMNLKFCPTDPLAITNGYPTEVRARHYFFGPSFMLFSFFIGMGVHGVLSEFRKSLSATKGMACVLLLFFLLPAVSNFKSDANRRGNWIPSDYGENMLASCEEGGIIFTNGDNDTFPLWFVQEVKGFKKWEGPGRGVVVANLSLLNTSWYIKQLRDRGIPVSFSDWVILNLYPTNVVKDGKRLQGQMLYTKDIAIRDIMATNAGYKFEPKVLLPILRHNLPRKYRKRIRSQYPGIDPRVYTKLVPRQYWVMVPEEYLLPPEDFAALVLQDYKGEIPIYFATTVSRENVTGYEKHLRLEGLAYRLVPEEGLGMIDIRKTEDNLFNLYSYRGIIDADGKPDQGVVKDDNTIKLISNYAAGFFALGSAYEAQRQYDKAIGAYEMGKSFKPRDTMPFNYHLSQLYLARGELDSAEKEALESVESKPDEPYARYLLGEIYRNKNDLDRATQAYRKAIELEPQSPMGYAGLISVYTETGDSNQLAILNAEVMKKPRLVGGLVQLYSQRGDLSKAKSLLERWLALHPEDERARDLLQRYESSLRGSSSKPRSRG